MTQSASRVHDWPILRVASALRSKSLSPIGVTAAILSRISELNPKLHAYTNVFWDAAEADARQAASEIDRGLYRGPLHGIPVGLKDVIEYGPTTAGSPLFRDRIAETDAECVRLLRRAGAIVIGKLSTNEFALAVPTRDDTFPPAQNPWRRGLSPGGSSTGAGVAVSAGLAFAAVGTDTGGSIRNPASHCGVVGFKPTLGRLDLRGVIPLSATLDHLGVMGRTTSDVAIMFDAIAEVPVDPGRRRVTYVGQRVGIPWTFFEDVCDPQVLAAFRRAVVRLETLGARTSSIDWPLTIEDVASCLWQIVLPEALAYHAEHLQHRPRSYGREMRMLLAAGALVGADEHHRAVAARNAIADSVRASVRDGTLLALPTLASPPKPIPATSPPLADRLRGSASAGMPAVFNLAGIPAI